MGWGGLHWDGKVNVVTLFTILAVVLAFGGQQANNITTARQVNDLESRMRAVEGPVIERLIRVEEQNKTIIKLLENGK